MLVDLDYGPPRVLPPNYIPSPGLVCYHYGKLVGGFCFVKTLVCIEAQTSNIWIERDALLLRSWNGIFHAYVHCFLEENFSSWQSHAIQAGLQYSVTNSLELILILLNAACEIIGMCQLPEFFFFFRQGYYVDQGSLEFLAVYPPLPLSSFRSSLSWAPQTFLGQTASDRIACPRSPSGCTNCIFCCSA